jgi:hypothetical protein
MEWLGTGFVLTIGGMRLRVRIALEDAPDPYRAAREPADGAAGWGDPPVPRQRQRPRAPEDASSMN